MFYFFYHATDAYSLPYLVQLLINAKSGRTKDGDPVLILKLTANKLPNITTFLSGHVDPVVGVFHNVGHDEPEWKPWDRTEVSTSQMFLFAPLPSPST